MNGSEDLIIRPATRADLPEIKQVHEANWRRDYAGILPEYALGQQLSDHMRALWHEGALTDRRAFVARDGSGGILGFAAMRDEGGAGGAFLDNLHVIPSARAQGVGRALMSATAVMSVPGRLSLEVLSANRDARAIYRAWGGAEGPEFIERIMGIEVASVTFSWGDTVWLVDRLSGADV